VDVNELRTALSRHDPDPDAVLDNLKAKRQRRHRRRQGIVSSLAVAAIIAAGAGAWFTMGPPSGSHHSANQPGSAAEAAGCTPLDDWLSRARGSSVITGVGTLSGRTGLDGYINHEVVITNIKTLSGPKIADATRAWVSVPEHKPKPGVVDGGPDGPLWGPGNTFFGVYTPQKLNGGPLGATLRQLPLVGDKVIFVSAGCWGGFSIGQLRGTPYRGPLTEVPGSGQYAHLAPQGFVAVPLTAVEDLLPR